MDAKQWFGMVIQADAGAQASVEKVFDRNSSVFLAGF